MLTATSSAQKAEIFKKRPDRAIYGEQMSEEIGKDLNQSWAMPYMIWLMNYHPTLSADKVRIMMNVAQKSHMNSPQLGEFCIALAPAGVEAQQGAEAPDSPVRKPSITQQKLRFIENVISKATTTQIRGQASLALSGVVAKMGDSPEINARRVKLIRQAIIDAAEAKVGEVTVGDLAKEEIYRMSKLSKGAVAPELVGRDAMGAPMRLSTSRGKIVVLVFWTSWEQPVEVSNFLKKLEESYRGKPLDIIGVNRDTLFNLREMMKADLTVGKTFSDPNGELFTTYRVTASPVCYVLDKEGVIQYNGPLGSFADLTASALLAQ